MQEKIKRIFQDPISERCFLCRMRYAWASHLTSQVHDNGPYISSTFSITTNNIQGETKATVKSTS